MTNTITYLSKNNTLSDDANFDEFLKICIDYHRNYPIELSVFKSVNAKVKSKTIGWNGLITWVRNPSIGDKLKAQLITPHNGTAKTGAAATKAEFPIVVIDYDNGAKKFDDVLGYWQGQNVRALMFTTSSHTDRAPRFKVVLRLSEPIDADEWHELAGGLAILQGADPAQARASQGFFAPNKLTDSSEYRGEVLEGESFSRSRSLWNEAITAFEQQRSEAEAKATPKPRKADPHASDIVGEINDAYDIPKLLESSGLYEQRGKRYLFKKSESRVPGVRILQRDGKEVVYSHHSKTDPLSALNHKGHSLDCADVLCALEYDNDFKAMIRAEADKLDPEGQKKRQREYMRDKERTETVERLGDATEDGDFDLSQFSLTGRSTEMRLKMLDDKFILGRLAILGQWTLFFARPNAGKTLLTLHLLIEAVKSREIVGKDIFYINADDNYKGLVQKLELVEPHGIHMLAPGHGNFKADSLLEILASMAKHDAARGKVVVLDTVKKFTDMMDKKESTKFGKVIRGFVSHGGTVIALAHVNKHRDGSGKVVFAGTSDLVDDSDCAYLLDTVSERENGLRTVEFENFKSRGDVASKVSYQYDVSAGMEYLERLNSVEIVSRDDLQAVKKQAELEAIIEKNKDVIPVITTLIKDGINTKTDLVKNARERSGESATTIRRVLKEHEGSNYLDGEYWYSERGDRGLTTYHLTKDIDECF